MPTPQQVRAINLIDCVAEDYPDVAEPPESAQNWCAIALVRTAVGARWCTTGALRRHEAAFRAVERARYHTHIHAGPSPRQACPAQAAGSGCCVGVGAEAWCFWERGGVGATSASARTLRTAAWTKARATTRSWSPPRPCQRCWRRGSRRSRQWRSTHASRRCHLALLPRLAPSGPSNALCSTGFGAREDGVSAASATEPLPPSAH
jgi:hypothetical protein